MAWRPDHFENAPPELRAAAHERMCALTEAYRQLVNLLVRDGSGYGGGDRESADVARWVGRAHGHDTDLRSGDYAEIVEIGPQDDFYTRRDAFLGALVLIRDPLPRGLGWYCVHVAFHLNPRLLARHADGALFGYVRLRRVIHAEMEKG